MENDSGDDNGNRSYRKRPPTFSVDGLDNDMDFQALRRKWSAPADGFRCKVRWDSC